jgi:hypothetical protein
MRIYQLRSPKEFYKLIKENLTLEEIMHIYAEHVAKKFAAECVNEALGNKMEVSNVLHHKIDTMYKSIIWDDK